MAKNDEQPKAAPEMYDTDDSFEIAFMWAKGLLFHHLERNKNRHQRVRAFFQVPSSVNLLELKKEWEDESRSRPTKDVLGRYKQFKDELRRFYISEAEQYKKDAIDSPELS